MTTARSRLVRDDESAYYHCRSRCVRRAFLCGRDHYTGKSFDHRKEWVRERLKLLVGVFAIELLAYALMANHLHTLLRTMPFVAALWSDDEVARRWLTLYPKRLPRGVRDKEAALDLHIQKIVASPERVAVLRRRLCSVSWFMKALNEHIAKRANREDDCTGSFWEGRFKCSRIEDEAALLACSVYIDLNPIRARTAVTPEESEFTSVQERIQSIKGKSLIAHTSEPKLWIAPIERTADQKGYLPISLGSYLSLVDVTGRIAKTGKKGRIPDELAPILKRLGVSFEHWAELSHTCGRRFPRAMGREASLKGRAQALGQAWLKGVSVARRFFT